MHFQSLFLGLGLAHAAAAHSVFSEFYINGQGQGPATCVRLNKDSSKASFPIGIGGPESACGYTGTEGRERVCPVPDGAEVSFFWTSFDTQHPDKQFIDPSHKGPCAVYMKKVDSAITDEATGDGWFKIWEQGFDGQKWCTENMIANKGIITVKVPKGMRRGYYLIRSELLALHSASNKDNPDPQFYAGCAQVFLEGSGDLGPAETVSIPGYVKMGEPSVSWNLYYGMDHNKYPTPGPKVARLVSGGGGGSSQEKQTEGLRPANCVFQTGNFCATEVPDWTDNQSCWRSQDYCWRQNDACWKAAVIGTYDGCKVVETRCKEIAELCKGNVNKGPPNKGKILDLPRKRLDGSYAPAPAPGTGADEEPVKEEPVKEEPVKEEPVKEEPKEDEEAEQTTPEPEQPTEEETEETEQPKEEEEEVEQPEEEEEVEQPEEEEDDEQPEEEEDDESCPSSSIEDNEATITAPPSGTVTGADGVVTVYQDVWVTEYVYVTVDTYAKRHAHIDRHAAKHGARY